PSSIARCTAASEFCGAWSHAPRWARTSARPSPPRGTVAAVAPRVIARATIVVALAVSRERPRTGCAADAREDAYPPPAHGRTLARLVPRSHGRPARRRLAAVV